MRKLITFLLLFFTMILVFANDNNNKPLNLVAFQLHAEKWVTTDTAKVIVGIDGTLNKRELESAHKVIMEKLTKLSSKEPWYITSFYRSQDKSGLERLRAQAEARLPESELAGLRDKAKAISRPGLTFRITMISFTPSLKAIEEVRNQLRVMIYKEASTELQKLNQVYTKQHYYLHTIRFGGVAIPRQYTRAPAANLELAVMKNGAAPSLAVSNKATITAIVVLASS